MLGRIKREFEEGKTLLGFGFLSACGQALGMIVPLVVAKIFSPSLFGSYSLARMVIFFFTSFLIASSQTPFIVFANQERAKSGKINETFSAQCVFFVSSLCAVAVITLLLRKYITKFAGINTGDLLFVQLAFVGFALKSFVCNLFMATGERMKNAFAEMVFGFLSLAIVFILYFTRLITLRTTLLMYLISACVLIMVFIKVIDFRLLLPLSFNKGQFGEMFHFTKWLIIGAAAAYLVDWGDNFVLRYFLSMEDIGNYNLGYQIFKGVASLILIIHGYFLPFVSQHIDDSAVMRNYLYSKRPRIFLLGLAFIGVLFTFCPYILSLIYEDVYQNSVATLRILLIGASLILYVVFYETILLSAKKYKFIQIVNVIQVSINLGLDLLLVPAMGMLGAAVATVIAYFCRVVIMETYFRLRLRKLW